MIFFNEKKLARKLHEGQVTEQEQMIYLSLYVMTCVFLTTMFINHAVYYDSPVNTYSYLYDLVTLTFTLGTIVYCSFVNKQGDGKNMITKYICLTVPLIIKFSPLFIITSNAGYFLDDFVNTTKHLADGQNVPNTENEQEGPFLVLLYILCSLLLLWRYKVAFEIASGKVELK